MSGDDSARPLRSCDRIRPYWSETTSLPGLCVGSYLQMADWLYAGPSAALSAWPTWVCVRPRDSRRILNALANSRISSRLTPSTSLGAVCGSTTQHTGKNQVISPLFPCCIAHFPERWKQTTGLTQPPSPLNKFLKNSPAAGQNFSLCPPAVNCVSETCFERGIHLRDECRCVMALTYKCKYLITHTEAIWTEKTPRCRAGSLNRRMDSLQMLCMEAWWCSPTNIKLYIQALFHPCDPQSVQFRP